MVLCFLALLLKGQGIDSLLLHRAHCFLGLLSHWNKTTYGTPARVCVHTCVCEGGEQGKDRVSSRRAAYLDLYTVPRKSFFIDF